MGIALACMGCGEPIEATQETCWSGRCHVGCCMERDPWDDVAPFVYEPLRALRIWFDFNLMLGTNTLRSVGQSV